MNTQETVALWYDDYGEAIFTYILMMVKDYQHAEDLTQETFVKAYRKHSYIFTSIECENMVI